MEETQESSGNKKCNNKTKNSPQTHYHHHQNQFGFLDQNQCYQRYYYPPLLPLPPLMPLPPPLPQNHSSFTTKTHLQPSCQSSSQTQVPKVSISPGFQKQTNLHLNGGKFTGEAIVTAKWPDCGGVEDSYFTRS